MSRKDKVETDTVAYFSSSLTLENRREKDWTGPGKLFVLFFLCVIFLTNGIFLEKSP